MIIELGTSMTIGVLNIYDYNAIGPRAKWWIEICKFKLPKVSWILAYDFNFVKSLSNKLRGAPIIGIKQ